LSSPIINLTFLCNFLKLTKNNGEALVSPRYFLLMCNWA